MRTFVLTLTCTAALTGLALAGEVTLVKYDPKARELTVKDGEAEKTYKVTDKTKFTFVDQDGAEKSGDLAAAEKTLKNEKAAGRAKFDITTDNGTVTAVRFKGRNRKKPG
jgi:hypothetical protein